MNVLLRSLMLSVFLVMSACALTPLEEGTTSPTSIDTDTVNDSVDVDSGVVINGKPVEPIKSNDKPDTVKVNDLSELKNINLDGLSVIAAHDDYPGNIIVNGQKIDKTKTGAVGEDQSLAKNNSHSTKTTKTIQRQKPSSKEKTGDQKVAERQRNAKLKDAPPPRKKKVQAINKGNAASRALLSNSSKLMNNGQFRLAAVNAERALRVTPRNPQAYYQLSLIYKKQRKYAQALHFADKGLAQGGASKAMYSNLWRIKGDCYSAMGNPKAAAHAKMKARK